MGKSKELKLLMMGLKAFSHEGLAFVKDIMSQWDPIGSIHRISSVYQVCAPTEKNKHIHDLRSFSVFEGLVLAFSSYVSEPPLEILMQIKALEKKLTSESLQRSMSLHMLMYADETMMTPTLTLPHPTFHLSAMTLLPLAEIAPHAFHPVLKKSMLELGMRFVGTNWGEFVFQGQNLLVRA